MTEQLPEHAPQGTSTPAGSTPGHRDPGGEAPWAMQLVAHVEKKSRPSRSAVYAAAAVAVVQLLADERLQPGGELYPAVERWLAGHIRKHARRARGAAWDRIHQLELPGHTVTVDGAEVRAFLPTATDAIPTEVYNLQMDHWNLEVPATTVVDAQPNGPVVVSISPAPPLPEGKAAAAAGHAAQVAAMTMPADRLGVWAAAGYPVVVEHPDVSRWQQLRTTAPVTIEDAGFTVVEPGTTTAVARWA